MAQSTDIVLSDQLGAPFRAELNQILSALGTDNSGNSEPLNTYQFMKWVDTSNATYYYIKERNHDDTAWVILFRYTVATKIMEAVSNGVVLSQTNIASEIHASTSKTTPVDADELGLIDSASTFTLKKLTWANLKATLKTYFDTLYQVILVSGTNIKTINSNSILGSGDLVIANGISLATANSYDLGVGQTWQDVTGSRVAGTTYTNSTGKPIELSLFLTTTNANTQYAVTINGTAVYNTHNNGLYNPTCSLSIIIPTGSTYSLSLLAGTGAIGKWSELR